MTFWRCESRTSPEPYSLGEVGEVEHVVSTHPSDEHVQPDEVPAVILVVDADQVVALALAGVVGVLLANVAPGGFELEVDVLLLKRLANFVCAPLVDEETSPARCTGPRGRSP